ncbi:hypothetical protein [Chryseobacterium sp. SC28]|uniref:hypothetical protein n=1 Tax=Chryseobacterium sp. SC28 TaxID=2268028 RepID=UPI000F6539FC|nr:hypothetical protein [Chryseobacterium sp. SC28]
MKNITKMVALSLLSFVVFSCTTSGGGYAAADPYSQGFSDGYRAGYYQSPDGFWYAPNVVYLDYNNNYYQNGVVYVPKNRNRTTVIVSPKRNYLQNQIPNNARIPSTTRTQQNATRTQKSVEAPQKVNSATRNPSPNTVRMQPRANSGTRTQPQNNVRIRPQNPPKSAPQNNPAQPAAPQDNSRRSGSR